MLELAKQCLKDGDVFVQKKICAKTKSCDGVHVTVLCNKMHNIQIQSAQSQNQQLYSSK
mgnify:CR=1